MILNFHDSSNAELLFKLIYLTNDQHMCLEDASLCVYVCGPATVMTKTRNAVGHGACPRAAGQGG